MWGKYPSLDLSWGLGLRAGEMEQQCAWVMLGHGYHREAAVQENREGGGQRVLGQSSEETWLFLPKLRGSTGPGARVRPLPGSVV